MNRIDNSGQGIASLGRDEDQYMAHVAQGEMVVPPVISQETRQRIEQEMKAAGLSPNEYTVGNGMSINPITGQPEFGWLKKTFKSVKKVAKKAAPILGVASMFIPGLGPAVSGMLKAIPGVGGALSTGFNFMTGAGGAGKAATAGKGMFGGTLGPRIRSGLGSFFKPGADATGIFGGKFGPNIRSGIGSMFSGMGGQEETMYEDQFGNQVSAEQYANMNETDKSLYNKIQNSNFLQKIFGGGNQEGGILNLLGGNNQGGGMDPKMFALALALGQATKKSAEERAGGLSQTPEVTMDALGRYSMANTLGTGGTREEFGLSAAPKSFSPEVFAAMGGPIDRQYFNKGGIAAVRELDMRDGGESAGPGTGTSDDIPAMLSDGEFVMTAAATKGAGAFNLNKTKSGIELISGGKSSRKKGVENMRELMDIFEAI